MLRPDLPVELLLRAVPDLSEFAILRRAILAASSADPRAEWAGSNDYATYEQRVLSLGRIGDAIRTSYGQSVRRVRRTHRALRRAFSALALDQGERAVDEILALGAAAEKDDHWQDAVAFNELAILFCTVAGAPPEQYVLALRRAARARVRAGDMNAADAHYRASLAAAETIHDTESIVIALTGLGNIASLQGRWNAATASYRQALDRASEHYPQRRGPAYINLSMTARERGDLDDARRWLDHARELWDATSPADRAVWCNNLGLLHLAENDLDRAETAFADALEQAPQQFDRAMIFDNLAELCFRRGQWVRAELYARRAEEYALSVGSDRALADAYLRLGRLHRDRNDANAVGFFEQAILIARRGPYPMTEARARREYALFRRDLGDFDDALGHLQEAIRLFHDLGAEDAEASARSELNSLEQR